MSNIKNNYFIQFYKNSEFSSNGAINEFYSSGSTSFKNLLFDNNLESCNLLIDVS